MKGNQIWCLMVVSAVLSWASVLLISGCGEQSPLSSLEPRSEEGLSVPLAQHLQDPPPPAGLVQVSFAGTQRTFWPYAGANIDATPSDPVNLIFLGEVHPAQLRAALLSLDGDRTAFGIPDVYPFNATWHDAIGSMLGAFEEGIGWTGSVVQLECGDYDPVRMHLRLWQTAAGPGETAWTLGAVHFDLMIPGTADHQVLSWEVPEQIVFVDLIRTGLLDPALPYGQSEVIYATPSWRAIPPPIYNAIPDGLKVALGLPPGQASEPVPIPADGIATILNVAQPAPVAADEVHLSLERTYGLVIPKPFCNDGDDFVLVTGPVEFETTVQVDAAGRVTYHANYSGDLTITPWDPVNNEPLGEPYPAFALGRQHGTIHESRIFAWTTEAQRSEPPGGTEWLINGFRTVWPGRDSYQLGTHCLDAQ